MGKVGDTGLEIEMVNGTIRGTAKKTHIGFVVPWRILQAQKELKEKER